MDQQRKPPTKRPHGNINGSVTETPRVPISKIAREDHSLSSQLSRPLFLRFDPVKGQSVNPVHSGLLFKCKKGSAFFEPSVAKSPVRWPDFVCAANQPERHGIAAVFRAVLAAAAPYAPATPRDFHMRVENCRQRGFVIRFLMDRFGSGPVAAAQCMSCDLDCTLAMGITGDDAGCKPVVCDRIQSDVAMNRDAGPALTSLENEAQPGQEKEARDILRSCDTLLCELELGTSEEKSVVRVWMDAKARNMLILTPLRHVESMDEMTDCEVASLWTGLCKVLDHEKLDWDDVVAIVVNSGTERNHAHLHMKVRIQYRAFENARERWDAEQKARWERLEAFAVEAARPVFEHVVSRAPDSVRTVFVGELACKDGVQRNALISELRLRCSEFGTVKKCVFVDNRRIGFVAFDSHSEAAAAIVGLYRCSLASAEGVPFFSWGKK